MTRGDETYAAGKAGEVRAYVYTASGQRFESAWSSPDRIPATEQFSEVPIPLMFAKDPGRRCL
jgi:hypothetical protein